MRAQVAEALRSGKQLDPAALARKADFQSVGIEPTLGQITRNPTQFANERNLRGVANVGEPLMVRFANQNRQLGEKIGDSTRITQRPNKSQDADLSKASRKSTNH